jgi:diadenosine tetraphosphate (Ap4A) HIT family hydrolase
MQDVTHAARAIHAAFQPAKINYGAYSDKLPHLHFHLVPKYVDGPSWGTTFTMMPENKHLLTDTESTDTIQAIQRCLDTKP